jgi:hypothetical protein
MENVIETLVALVITSGLIFGTSKSVIWLHDEIKREALSQVSNGLSSSEKMSQALTGEQLEF